MSGIYTFTCANPGCKKPQPVIREAQRQPRYCDPACGQAVRGKRYTQKSPEKAVARSRKWQNAHRDQVREKDRRYYREQRRRVLEHYGAKCVCCGTTVEPWLTVDHINNDGAQHRKEGVTTIYRWLVANNFPEGFQILCWNCNAAKQWAGGCPCQSQ